MLRKNINLFTLHVQWLLEMHRIPRKRRPTCSCARFCWFSRWHSVVILIVGTLTTGFEKYCLEAKNPIPVMPIEAILSWFCSEYSPKKSFFTLVCKSIVSSHEMTIVMIGWRHSTVTFKWSIQKQQICQLLWENLSGIHKMAVRDCAIFVFTLLFLMVIQRATRCLTNFKNRMKLLLEKCYKKLHYMTTLSRLPCNFDASYMCARKIWKSNDKQQTNVFWIE